MKFVEANVHSEVMRINYFIYRWQYTWYTHEDDMKDSLFASLDVKDFRLDC